MSMRIRLDMYIGKKDNKAENLILNAIPYNKYAAHKAYEYARYILEKPWSKGEEKILQCPRSSYLYARYVLKKRWPKAEATIAKDAYSSYLYARFVIKGRFELAEKEKSLGSLFSTGWFLADYTYLYAKNISKERLKRSIEKKIAISGRNVNYAKIFFKNKRWKIAENSILDHSHNKIQSYMKILKEKDRKDFHKKILLNAMTKQQYHYNPAKCWIETYGQEFLKENTANGS
jgi:hypothetical protein